MRERFEVISLTERERKKSTEIGHYGFSDRNRLETRGLEIEREIRVWALRERERLMVMGLDREINIGD